jgi:PIN domain nuclease of toxin-antitoxin system
VKLLLDTHCFLWWFAQPERLSEGTIAHIVDETNELWFSAASIWEMGIKVTLGKLLLPEQIDSYISSHVVQSGTRSLETTAFHALTASALPLHHRNPSNRMLIAQAQLQGMTFVSADEIFGQYEVDTLWVASS